METFYHIFVPTTLLDDTPSISSYVNLGKITFHSILYRTYELDELVRDLKGKEDIEITPDYIRAYMNSIGDIEMYMSKENGELEIAEVDYKLLTQFVITELNEAD